MGDKKNKTFLYRFLSGTVLFILVVAAVLISRYSFLAMLFAICLGSMREFYRMAKAKGAQANKALGMTTGILMITSIFLYTQQHPDFLFTNIGVILMPVVLLLTFTIFIAELFRKKDNPLTNITVTVCSLVYIALPLSLMCFISVGGFMFLPLEIPDYQPWTVLCYIFVIWSNDIGAYLAGVPFGRHKMFPRISPKKSWEGFAGGLIAATGIAVLSGWLLNQNIIFWAGLGIITGIFGVFGDLVESLFKRSLDIKDSGSIMPGHGGWLDRFDSLLIATPFVFVYFIIFALI